MITYQAIEEAYAMHSLHGREPEVMIVSPRTFDRIESRLCDPRGRRVDEPRISYYALRYNAGVIHQYRWCLDGVMMFICDGILLGTARIDNG